VSKLPTGVNIFEGGSENPILREFSQFALALPPGDEIRDLILRERIVPDALSFLSADSKDDPVLPVLLDTLAGMARGHSPTQELLAADDGRLLRLLQRRDQWRSVGGVGSDLATSLREQG
jgi:hypothetical protein